MSRKPSPQTVAVLRALDDGSAQWRHGYDIAQQTGLAAGSLYPILMRLAERGLLEATWEADPPLGRPRRHLYRIRETGTALLAEQAAAPSTDSIARSRSAARSPAAARSRPAVRRPRPDARPAR